jgi:hypothetical protein
MLRKRTSFCFAVTKCWGNWTNYLYFNATHHFCEEKPIALTCFSLFSPLSHWRVGYWTILRQYFECYVSATC